MIRKITTAGVVTTLRDTNGAPIWSAYPNGITVDAATNVYVSDGTSGLVDEFSPVGTNWVLGAAPAGSNQFFRARVKYNTRRQRCLPRLEPKNGGKLFFSFGP